MNKLTMKQIIDALDNLEDDCTFDISHAHCVDDDKKRTKLLIDTSKIAQAKALLISLLHDKESLVFNNINDY